MITVFWDPTALPPSSQQMSYVQVNAKVNGWRKCVYTRRF